MDTWTIGMFRLLLTLVGILLLEPSGTLTTSAPSCVGFILPLNVRTIRLFFIIILGLLIAAIVTCVTIYIAIAVDII